MKSVIQDFFVQEILLFFISSHKLGWYVRKWIITKQNGLLSASCQITFCSKEQAYRASCQISHCGKWWAFRAICKISCHGKQQSLGPAAMYVVENSGPLGPTAKLVVAENSGPLRPVAKVFICKVHLQSLLPYYSSYLGLSRKLEKSPRSEEIP